MDLPPIINNMKTKVKKKSIKRGLNEASTQVIIEAAGTIKQQAVDRRC